MRRQSGGVKYLLDKLQSLSSQNAQLKNTIRQRENFNRRLCSENRKRRLKNNQLNQLENQRLLELASLKGHEEELRRAAQGLKRGLEESEQRLDEAEDQIVLLKSELTKLRQEYLQLEDQVGVVKRNNDRKDSEIQKLNTLRAQIMKKKTPMGNKQPDYETEVIELLCQNQQMEMRIADAFRDRDQEQKNAEMAEQRVRELQDELRNQKEIMGILREEYEQELKDMASSVKEKTPNPSLLKPTLKDPPLKPVPSIVTSVPQEKHELFTRQPPKSTIRGPIPAQKYGTRLACNQSRHFSSYPSLLLLQNSVYNLQERPVTVHHCEPVQLFGTHSWFSRIGIAAEGEVQLGVSSVPYGAAEEVMRNKDRHYIYFSNCSGLVVVGSEGKFIDQYATLNDTLTLVISIVQNNATLRIFKNDQQIYQIAVGQPLSSKQTLYPFIRLFRNMGVTLQ